VQNWLDDHYIFQLHFDGPCDERQVNDTPVGNVDPLDEELNQDVIDDDSDSNEDEGECEINDTGEC